MTRLSERPASTTPGASGRDLSPDAGRATAPGPRSAAAPTAYTGPERRSERPPGVLSRIPPAALLDLHRLATLREVSRCGSYSAAADSLCFTPSAVSLQMTGLARDLKFRLFDRTPRGMRLTAAAELLVTHVEAVFSRLNDAQGDLDGVAGGVRGRLRVGSFPTATAAFVADTMATFEEHFPQVRLSLADGEPHESVNRLKERELDLALVYDFDHRALAADFDGRLTCSDSEIHCEDLFDDSYLVALPREHPLTEREEVAIADLVDERIVSGPPGCSPWGVELQQLCREAGFDPSIDARYRTVNHAVLQAIVASRGGVTLVPRLAVQQTRSDIVVRPLVDGPVGHVRIATLAGAEPSNAGTAMIELLRVAAGDRDANAPSLTPAS